eukprot:5416197-Amphidinium_carterae.1
MQPKGCKVAQPVTEFAYRLWIPCGDLPPEGEKQRTIAPHYSLPMGARLLLCSTLAPVVQISGVVGCCP